MGKKGKGVRAEQRKARKQAEKAAKRAKYAAFAQEGRLKGSRRFKNKSKGVRPISKGQHLCANCGNPGCCKCVDKIVSRNGEPLAKAPQYHADTARNPKRKVRA